MFRKLALKTMLGGLGVAVSTLLLSQTALAAPPTKAHISPPFTNYGDGCGDTSNFINVIIYVGYYDENDNFLGYSRDWGVRITTLNTSDNWYGNSGHFGAGGIQQWNSGGVINQVVAHNFNANAGGADVNYQACASQRTVDAGVGGANVGGVRALAFQNDLTPKWILNCGFQGNHSRGFQFDMNRAPGDMPGGYTAGGWIDPTGLIRASTNTSADTDLNNNQFVFLFKYRMVSNTNIHVVKLNESLSPDGGLAPSGVNVTGLGGPDWYQAGFNPAFDFTPLRAGTRTVSADNPPGWRLIGYRTCIAPCNVTDVGTVGASAFSQYTGPGQTRNVWFIYHLNINNSVCWGTSINGGRSYFAPGEPWGGRVAFYNNGDFTWWWGPYGLASAPIGLTSASPDLNPVNPGQASGYNFGFTTPDPNGAETVYSSNIYETYNGAAFGAACGWSIVAEPIYDYVPTLSQIPAVGQYVIPGQVVGLTSSVHNNPVSTGRGVNFTHQVEYCQAAYGTTCTPSNAGPFSLNVVDSGLAPNGTVTHNADFTIPAGTPDGTVYCFRSHINPSRNLDPAPPNPEVADSYSAAQTCMTVANFNYPYLTTNRGDVHGGGNVSTGGATCTLSTPSTGNINGKSGSSKGTYVVSAAGTIGGFGSNENPNSTNLTFSNSGVNGNYGVVCRADLVANAQAYMTSHPATTNIGGLGISNPGNAWMTEHVGSGTMAGGTVTKRWTLYVQGDVTITSDIVYAGGNAYSRANLPSFGMIVNGNINIQHTVHRLDGFYYATGKINTCSDYDPANKQLCSGDAAAGTGLTVNGFLNAKSFKFTRNNTQFVSGGQTTATEIANFLGQLYLATPPGFSDLSNTPQFQGERPPLY